MSEEMKQINILLAEDSPTDVKIMEWTIEKEVPNHKLFVVQDGQDALDLIYHKGAYEGKEQEFPVPDFILLDINMPKVSGLEVLKKIKEDPALEAIHVVIITHSQDEKDFNASYEQGAVSFINKSETNDELTSVLQLFKSYWVDRHS
ncbi:MAG: CheY-like chemotaxis protein [Lysobacterales bacterium]|jgi:CheY-like chemotaxis protein